MAMVLAGVGSIVAHELGKLALDSAPILRQVATDTAVGIAKKSFDLILDKNPNIATFLGHFGFTAFNKGNIQSTLTKRHRHRKITYHSH